MSKKPILPVKVLSSSKRGISLRDCQKNIVGMGISTPSEWAGFNVESVQ